MKPAYYKSFVGGNHGIGNLLYVMIYDLRGSIVGSLKITELRYYRYRGDRRKAPFSVWYDYGDFIGRSLGLKNSFKDFRKGPDDIKPITEIG